MTNVLRVLIPQSGRQQSSLLVAHPDHLTRRACRPNFPYNLGSWRCCREYTFSSASLSRRHRPYTEAEPLVKRALAICEQELGSEHPDTANSLNNLRVLYLA